MKVIVYIDGEHNTVEVKDKIKSVLPDANYMIFDHTESKGKVTNYERIKNMSVEEMALMFHTLIKKVEQKLIDKLVEAEIPFEKISLADEIQIEIHKQYLESEVETE